MRETGATTSGELRLHNLVRLLRAVHEAGAGATRSELTRSLGLSRGTAAVLAGELANARLIREEIARQGTRGRPTGIPRPHPDGPLALAVDLREDVWTIAAAELGGRPAVLERRPHPGAPAEDVLGPLAAAIRRHREALAPRSVGVAVAAPGPVRDGRLLDIPHLGWREIDVVAALQPALLDNDATLAGLAEARRGALRARGLGLHLHIEFDLGGALILNGNPIPGSRGAAGEFGHMPLIGSDRPCPCGATGCWGLEVGANALLRATGRPPQDRPGALEILADPAHQAVVDQAASILGIGISALVNALDPEIVTLSGLGAGLLARSAEALETSYQAGLMDFRREHPAAVVPSALGAEATLIGASELAFDAFLTPAGVGAWLAAHEKGSAD
ncbi:ROK family protein [Actinomadura fulvescens]|uniref:ROK family transcriptional regulator n=1 Tax=Actinomadura fulvescens TaxID=46160 RepID=A0ABN3PSP7_9ACTN